MSEVIKHYTHLDETRHRVINGTEYRFRHTHHVSRMDPALRPYPRDKNIGTCRISVQKRLPDYPGGAPRWVWVHNIFKIWEAEGL